MAAADQYVEDPDLDFDEPLGAAQGVIAFSNIDDYYFSGEKHYTYGVYTGYKYQCVEYARRYMLLRCKCIFGQCGPAAEIFAMTTVENVETGETLPFIACKNGETKVKPAVGMTYIYPQSKKMPVGHVAVISAVGDDWVGIAEQNQESKFWKGLPYGRRVPLKQNPDGTWLIEEPDPSMTLSSGWLYIEGVTFEESSESAETLSTVNPSTLDNKIYRPPQVLPKYIAPPTLPKKIIRFNTKLSVPTSPTFSDAACKDASAVRAQIVGQYQALVAQRFAQSESQTSHHHIQQPASGPTFRRSAVPRTTEWHSVYSPNEPLMIGGIGEALKAFHIVERCVRDLLKNESAERVAAQFDMPVAAVKAAADHLLSSVRASSALAAGDSMLGSLGLAFDSDSDSYRIIHAELDSLNLLMDMNALQDEHVADHGHQAGFRMTSFGNDFNRSMKNLQKWRYGRASADLPIYFLDFGDAEALEKQHGFVFASEDDKYQYTVERLNHLYVAHTLSEFLANKKRDVELGDLMIEDMPTWQVRVVDNAISALKVDAAQGVEVEVNGQTIPLNFAWKCAPWWAVFQISEKVPSLAKLTDYVYSVQSDFLLNPLWTHICSHPRFPKHLSVFAEAHDAAKNDGDFLLRDRVVPSSCWADSDALPPPCTYGIKPHSGVVDPTYPHRQEVRVDTTKLSPKPEAQQFHMAIQMMLSSGKRSGALALEARFVDGQTSCSIYDLVHPAPLSYMPFLHKWGEEEARE